MSGLDNQEVTEFQSTHLREVRPEQYVSTLEEFAISIHAPT